MKNDPIRIQSDTFQSCGGTEQRRKEWMDGSILRLQSCLTDETYSDGYVDYTHEI